jgi:hypothetical protein
MTLSVFVDTGAVPEAYTPLSSTTTRFKVIKASIDLALSFLESTKATDSLRQVAGFIVEECRADESAPSGLIYQKSAKTRGLTRHVQDFLKALRREFPPVYVSNTVKGEASALRVHWGTNLDDWRPRSAGTMYLHQTIIDNMIYARDQSNEKEYQILKFQLSMAIAHELVHFLTGTLINVRQRANTPPEVTASAYGDSVGGEAGRYWEAQHLGGFVEYWSSPKATGTQSRQAGEPMLFSPPSRRKISMACHAVSMDYIEDFNKKSKCPCPLDGCYINSCCAIAPRRITNDPPSRVFYANPR